MDAILCDGCGQPATPQHIADRLRRLELATRYRPIHIQVLFLASAPPSGIANDFYDAASNEESEGQAGQNWARVFFEALNISPGAGNCREERLAEFQRRGYFLAFVSECPIYKTEAASAGGSRVPGVASVVTQLGPLVVKRIRYSYKPRFIVLLDRDTQPLVRILKEAGVENVLACADGAGAAWALDGGFDDKRETAALRSLLAEIQDRAK